MSVIHDMQVGPCSCGAWHGDGPWKEAGPMPIVIGESVAKVMMEIGAVALDNVWVDQINLDLVPFLDWKKARGSSLPADQSM